MAEQYGIKETKEAILALVVLGQAVAEIAKDGLQLEDLSVIAKKIADPDFKATLDAGVQGIALVPAELKDLSFAEILELAAVLPEILALLKV